MFDLSREYTELASSDRIPWSQLDGSSVFVTGATGLVGSLCVKLLLERNRCCNGSIRVYALVRSRDKALSVFEGYADDSGLQFVVGDLEDFSCDADCDYVIHTACPTASSFFASHPVETIDAIVGGTKRVLEYARGACSKAVVYVSSMEMYGMGNTRPGLDHLLTEADTGIVDPGKVRSCYPEGKRMAENYCVAYSAEYGLPVRIARLAQTFGPGIPKNDRRLFAEVARSAMEGNDIVLKTTGESTRMYVYTADAVAAIMTILINGDSGSAYNVANPGTYSSVRGMAEQVMAWFSNGEGHVVIDVDPSAPYPPEHHLPLDVSRLRGIGWCPTVDLKDMYRNLIDYLS